jgi:membrane protease YdiL (CAAX protease family)
VKQAVVRAPVASFVFIAFAISWGIWIPLLFRSAALTESVGWAIYYAGVIGPAAAAFVCAALGSPVTPATLFRRLTRWRVSLAWYGAALMLPFVIRGVALGAVAFFDDAASRLISRPPEAIGRIVILMIFLVPFEEVGWRGYLLPLLQRKHTALWSSIIVGAIWALWHLPLAWASVGYQRTDEPWRYMALFFVSIIPLSCLITWLFNRTGESLLLVSLLHVTINLADFVLILPARTGESILLLSSLLTALVVAAVWRDARVDREVVTPR